MEYQILDSTTAAVQQKDAKFLKQIEFNHSTVYLTSNSSYLVRPLYPFGESILIKDKSLLDRFIDEQYFPVDEVNKLYLLNKESVDNFTQSKEKLKKALISYVFKNHTSASDEILPEQIDFIFVTLKKRRLIKKYYYHFIALLGDYLRERYKADDFKWALLGNKQLLNPVINVILIRDLIEESYFNIEESIYRRPRYWSVATAIQEIENPLRIANDIETIMKMI